MSGFDPSQLVELTKKKYKILTLCDHPLSPSGVGVQANFLMRGLLDTGKYTVRSLGGAMKHSNYNIVQPHPEMIIKPVDNFGTKDDIRHLLLTERPDAIFIFTDPRQFYWVWEMADEIRQVCPIVYWHVWDNDPYPAFNDIWYQETDLLNCLSYKTYEMLKEHFPEKTNYVPHTFPKSVYYPMPKESIRQHSLNSFGDRADWFKILWVNRNATRKVPADVIASFNDFLNALEAKHGHRKALLVMHTDPLDMEGPNLLEVQSLYKLHNNLIFSTEKLEFDKMNVLHNMCDTLVNIAYAEGFGLSTLIQMMVGKPIVALKTGGMTRQVVDYRDGSENGVAIEPIARKLVGSQVVPYIHEDIVSHAQVVDAFMKIYEMTSEQKQVMSQKVLEYCEHEFSYPNMIKTWDETLEKTILDFKAKKQSSDRKNYTVTKIKNFQAPIEKQPVQNAQVDATIVNMPVDITKYILNNVKITKGAMA